MVSSFILVHPSFQVTFSQILVDLNISSINSIVLITRLSSTLDHYLSSYSSLSLCPERGLISSFTPDLMFFWIPQTVTWPIPSKFVTKFGKPKEMMPVPIVFLLIRSYLVILPFYLSVFCVNEWYGPAPVRLILTSMVRLPCYIVWPYSSMNWKGIVIKCELSLKM